MSSLPFFVDQILFTAMFPVRDDFSYFKYSITFSFRLMCRGFLGPFLMFAFSERGFPLDVRLPSLTPVHCGLLA